eukprot:1090884-Pelagomonas_calceolata.AAC.4
MQMHARRHSFYYSIIASAMVMEAYVSINRASAGPLPMHLLACVGLSCLQEDRSALPRWECLDDGSYTVTMPWLKQRAAYSCFCGNKLYTLKPSMHEKLWELQDTGFACTQLTKLACIQVTEFALPEDIERLRNSKKRDLGVSEKLQLLDDAICGVSSIELQWRYASSCIKSSISQNVQTYTK